jgi:hemoglobin
MRMSTITAAMLVTAVAAATATGAAAQMMQKSLYERLGGTPAIVAVVDDFVGNVAADRRINKFFARTDIPRLKYMLVQQICQGTGGPCIYTGRDMKTAHAGLGIGGRHFGALVQDLGKTLNKFRVPAREQKELVAVLAPMRKDIVTR